MVMVTCPARFSRTRTCYLTMNSSWGGSRRHCPVPSVQPEQPTLGPHKGAGTPLPGKGPCGCLGSFSEVALGDEGCC